MTRRLPIVLGVLAGCLLAALPVRAERLEFAAYSGAVGLGSVDLSCLRQDPSGFVLACTGHGLYVYDGRSFVGLGPAQGLPDGGVVYDLAGLQDGRLAVRFGRQAFVSESPPGPGRPPAGLRFHEMRLPDIGSYSNHVHRMAAWGKAVVLVTAQGATLLDPAGGAPRPVSGLPVGFLPVSVFAAAGSLWFSDGDGRVFSWNGTASVEYPGLHDAANGPWYDVAAMPSGNVVWLRSASSLGIIDRVSGRVSVERLPGQGGRYAGYARALFLAVSPSGDVSTQFAGGILVRRAGAAAWQMLDVDEGVPSVPIGAGMYDRQGALWLAGLGRGVFRQVGLGSWRSFDHRDGLDDDVVWQVARQQGGPLWVATDTGLDEFDETRVPAVLRSFPGSSYSLDVCSGGFVWGSAPGSNGGLVRLDPRDGSKLRLPSPPVNRILCDGDRVWLATENGTFMVEGAIGAAPVARMLAGLSGHTAGLVLDGAGGAWVLGANGVRHRDASGTVRSALSGWPSRAFDPLTIASGQNGVLWIGGSGDALYRFRVRDGRLVDPYVVRPPQILSGTVVALLVDRRGWVWAATGLGLSVFDGDHWVSVNSDAGLIWNDLSQGGLYEDTDGSIWVSTSQGLSHLLHPERVFDRPSPSVVVSDMRLGSRSFPAGTIPYSHDPLLLRLGTFDFAAERSMRFRYRLSGVDADWVDIADGEVRYPFVPPGGHQFEVRAFDSLTGRVSAPAMFGFKVAPPWWGSPLAEFVYALVMLAALVGAVRMRERHMMTRQRRLESLVADRTREMREAQHALVLQLTRDALTGLLTRRECQARLVALLSTLARDGEVLVAMIDLDHFKRINDTYGHLGGDDVLRDVGLLVSEATRDGDAAGRYGGEEILLVLSDLDGTALERVQSLHRRIATYEFRVDGRLVPVTCSIGLEWGRLGDRWESLVARVDAALYQAKRAGRNRVVAAGVESRGLV